MVDTAARPNPLADPAPLPIPSQLPERPTLEPPRPSIGLYRYVAGRSLGQQLRLTALVALATGVALVPIEMQKRLVNEAIGRNDLTALAQYGILFVLGALGATGLKFAINLYQAFIGERVLRDFRAFLYERIVGLPSAQLRRTPPAQLVSVVLVEADELGGFFGQAFSVPLVSGCMLLALTVYLVSLNPWTLGLLALHPIEIWVIPRLQARVNRLSRTRVALGRHLAAHLERAVRRLRRGSTASGSAAAGVPRFRQRLERIRTVRVRTAVFKYAIKWIGNGVARLGPFLLFMGGGWLIIADPGAFDLGRLVAALVAYDRLNEPWQELLDYYSAKEIATTRYAQILETVSRQER